MHFLMSCFKKWQQCSCDEPFATLLLMTLIFLSLNADFLERLARKAWNKNISLLWHSRREASMIYLCFYFFDSFILLFYLLHYNFAFLLTAVGYRRRKRKEVVHSLRAVSRRAEIRFFGKDKSLLPDKSHYWTLNISQMLRQRIKQQEAYTAKNQLWSSL